nr:hypothetical protein Iba_chr05bCG5040 [Ipomoea batatas]
MVARDLPRGGVKTVATLLLALLGATSLAYSLLWSRHPFLVLTAFLFYLLLSRVYISLLFLSRCPAADLMQLEGAFAKSAQVRSGETRYRLSPTGASPPDERSLEGTEYHSAERRSRRRNRRATNVLRDVLNPPLELWSSGGSKSHRKRQGGSVDPRMRHGRRKNRNHRLEKVGSQWWLRLERDFPEVSRTEWRMDHFSSPSVHQLHQPGPHPIKRSYSHTGSNWRGCLAGSGQLFSRHPV